MAATIYSPPKEIQIPKFDSKNWKEDEKEFLNQLKAWCKEENSCKYAGEVVRIPYADGYARYMVFNLTPLELIHIPLGDAYDSPYADMLTKKAVIDDIKKTKQLENLFSKK